MSATEQEHPSFGTVGVYHTTGNANLVGSEFRHQHFISLVIKRAALHRDLSHEWWFGRDEIVEIHMSEAQYIELMARPNMGSGVPCTIHSVMRERMPPPPVPVSDATKYRADMKADATACIKELTEAHAELIAAIESGKIGKTVLKDIAQKIHFAGQSIASGIPFVQQSFDENMEKTINHAKAEIEATVTNLAIRLGLEQMQHIAATAPMLLEEAK